MDILLEIDSLKKLQFEIVEQKELILNAWKGFESKRFLEKYDILCESLKGNIRALSLFVEE